MNFWRTLLILVSITFLFSSTNSAQTFDGEWITEYSTYDDATNGTGYNTVSVGVISENTFVALVRRPDQGAHYLVGYSNADSANGRMGTFANGSGMAGYKTRWEAGFDQVEVLEALDIAATPDSFIFVANNDATSSILVFKMSEDSVISTENRLETGADSLWAIDVDDNGYVYVTSIKDTLTSSEVLVFPPLSDEMWTTFTGSPLQTITVPAPGILRGVTTNSDGTILYVSNYTTEEIYCYTGSPVTGYTLHTGFDFTLTDWADSTIDPGPWGLGFMDEKNILFVSAATNFTAGATSGYRYGKIFALNPNTGETLDTIDAAEWNLAVTGFYNDREGGTVGTASGYTSTYNVDFDENFNLYNQSYYGWAVDKWNFTGELPVIPLTIVSVEREDVLPDNFSLSQNYPNPFNPSTTIKFSIPSTSDVSLNVYSINGELISTLINSSQFEKGSYELTFNASKLASGTYLYVLKYGDQQITRKMTLLK